MAVPFKLSILSPRGRILEGAVDSLVVPGVEGDLGVLAHHAPLLAALRRGIMRVTAGGATRLFVSGRGLIEVTRNDVHVLVDYAEPAENDATAKQQLAAHLQETADNPGFSV